MGLGRTHRQLGEVSPSETLHEQLAAQTAAMTERLRYLRLRLADLEGKVLQLKTLQADLRLNKDVQAVSSRLRYILADMVAQGEDPFADLADDLSYHEELQATLSHLKRGGLLG